MLTPPQAESTDVSPCDHHRGDGSLKRRESQREFEKRRAEAERGEAIRVKVIEEQQKRIYEAYAAVMGFEEPAT